MDIFDFVKFFLLGTMVFCAVALTWSIQDWRWQSKETNYVKEQLAELQKEETKEAKAATQFEKKSEGTNETYNKIDKALSAIPSKPPVVCFGNRRLRVVNSALARKAPDPGGPSGALSGPVAAGKQ